MNGRALVSVVIPSFNSAEYARGAVESVLRQTHRNFEVLLVDDGSKPEAARVLDEVARQDKVRLLRQENQGPAKARRHGWEAARGEFVSFLDDDDRYEETYLEKCLASFEKEPHHGAVYTRYVFVKPDGGRERVLPETGPTGWIFRQEVRKSTVKTSTLMARRAALLKLDGLLEHLIGPECYDMVLRLAYENHFGFVDEVLVRVTKRQGSLSRSGPRTFLGRVEILEHLLKVYPDMDAATRRLVGRKLARYCVKTGERLSRWGEVRQAREIFGKAFSYHWSVSGLKAYLVNLLRTVAGRTGTRKV